MQRSCYDACAVSRLSKKAIRPYLGAFALALGCLGILVVVLGIAAMAVLGGLYPGFSPDGPGMSGADRSAAASERSWEIIRYQLLPLFVVSTGLIVYGFYEAAAEQKKKDESSGV